MTKKPLDVIVTSCGRFDLLRRMLDSFFEYADKEYEYRVYVYDDMGEWDSIKNGEPSTYHYELNLICNEFPDVSFSVGSKRIGQIAAIDYLMTHVKTDYYIHLEDDWEFVKTGWVRKSIWHLSDEMFSHYIQVWLRGLKDLNGHPINVLSEHPFGDVACLSTQYHWKGFSFNPAVRRLSDYQLIGKYGNVATFNPKDPSSAERKIGEWYCKKGFVAGVFHEQYVRHTGDNRGIRK